MTSTALYNSKNYIAAIEFLIKTRERNEKLLRSLHSLYDNKTFTAQFQI